MPICALRGLGVVNLFRGDHAKVHGGAHGPALQQRQFRRKSGG